MLPPTHNELEATTQAALAFYGLEAAVITPVRSWNHPVFRVDTVKGSFALRWHRQSLRTEAQIRGELAFLKHLSAAGLAVPKPVSTLIGDVLLTPEESGVALHHCDVMSWLEGEVRRRPQDGLDPTAARQLGFTLARIHLASRDFVLPPEADLPNHDAASLVTEVSPHHLGPLEPWFSKEDLAVIHEVVLEAQTAFARFAGEQRQVGTIHNDFILGNCHWQGNELRVLDFADCGVGLYLYDLAPMLTNFSGEPLLREHFIEGYASLQPLSTEHRAALPLMEAVRHIRVCWWLIGKAQRGEDAPPLERHLEARMAEVRELMSA